MKTKPINLGLMQLGLVISSFLAIVYCSDPDSKNTAAADAITAVFVFASILMCGLIGAYSLQEWSKLQAELKKTKRHYSELMGKPQKTR